MGSTGDPPVPVGDPPTGIGGGGLLVNTSLYWLGARSPFRPASRRAVQASGPLALN